MFVMISMKIVTLSAMNAMVTDFDCGEFIADCILILLSLFILNSDYYKSSKVQKENMLT